METGTKTHIALAQNKATKEVIEEKQKELGRDP